MFNLPTLKYPYDALDRFIDALTMELHHTKHHGTYVNNLNLAIQDYEDLKSKSLEDLIGSINNLPEEIKVTVRNNGGGHWNHSFFWEILSPSVQTPSDNLINLLNKYFQNFDNFKQEFKQKSLKLFGSGWCWVIKNSKGDLEIVTTSNQDNPLMDVVNVNGKPILGLDLWEHAYYLRYQNRRADYIDKFWDAVNWDRVEDLYFN